MTADGELHPAIEFIKKLFGPSTNEAVYICSLPNEKGDAGQAGERSISDRDGATLSIFLYRWDEHGRGCYFCLSTILSGRRRQKPNAVEMPAFACDIDFKSILDDEQTVDRKLLECRCPPSLVVHSGHGRHPYWILKEALPTQEYMARIEAVQRQLADVFAGDLQPAHVVALMRLPGTHNTKGGQWWEVTVTEDTGRRYELEELEDWLAEQSPMLRRKERPPPPEQNPYATIAAQLGFKPPTDVEKRLAEMQYQGAGDRGIHATQVAVTSSLISRGVPVEDVIKTVYSATMAAAGDYGARWNWRREEINIRKMCTSWIDKIEAPPQQVHPLSADVVNLAAFARTDARLTRNPKPPLLLATPFVLRPPEATSMREWLYGNHLVRKFGSATIAPGGIGKTSLAIVEALAIVTGRPLLGITPPQRSKVWIWNGEDPYEEIERRIVAACLHYRITPLEIEGGLFVNSGRDTEIAMATQTREGVKISEPTIEALIKTIKENEIDIVYIDPFISSHRVPENDNIAIGTVAKCFTQIADITNTAIDLTHHSRKTGGAAVTVEDGRGASALLDAVRSARVLNTMTEEEALRCGVDHPRSYFKLTNGKANLAPPPEAATWCQLKSVELGNGPLVDPFGSGDKVGVVTAWKWPDPLEGMTGGDFEKVAAVIRTGEWRRDSRAADKWAGQAIAKALGLNLEDRRDKARVGSLLKIWLAAGSLVVVKRLDPDQRKSRDFIELGGEE